MACHVVSLYVLFIKSTQSSSREFDSIAAGTTTKPSSPQLRMIAVITTKRRVKNGDRGILVRTFDHVKSHGQ